MNLWSGISEVFKPVSDTIDNLHTSEAEKKELKNVLEQTKNDAQKNILDYEAKLLNAKRDIIVSEAEGESWLQRNWRPLLMLTVVAIVANNYLIYPYLAMFTEKVTVLDLPNGLWALLTTGVGGYVVGRSGEKISKNIKNKSS